MTGFVIRQGLKPRTSPKVGFLSTLVSRTILVVDFISPLYYKIRGDDFGISKILNLG